jgi:hypothetical protein
VPGTGTGALNNAAAQAISAAAEPMPWETGAESIEVVASVNDRNSVEAAKDERYNSGDIQDEMAMLREASRTREAVNSMPEEAQAQYETVLTAARESGVPDADAAIQQMARTGQFQRSPELLPALNQLATQKPAARLAEQDPNVNNRLVGELARQLSNPSAIQQDPGFDTCAQAAMEQQFAAQQPAQYAQFIADMASADKYAQTASGANIGLPVYGLEGSEGSTRSLASAMYQQGMNAAFNQGQAEDSLTTDSLQAMVKAQFPNQEVVTFGQDQAWAATGQLKEGTIAIVETGEGVKHAVNVTSNNDGEITYNDPQGRQVTTSAAEFQKVLVGAVLPQDSGIRSTHENFGIGEGAGTVLTSGRAGGRR